MSDLERLRAQHEAADAAAKTPSSADRARFWAGMNRYLGTEARHAHRVAEREREREAGHEDGHESDDAHTPPPEG